LLQNNIEEPLGNEAGPSRTHDKSTKAEMEARVEMEAREKIEAEVDIEIEIRFETRSQS